LAFVRTRHEEDLRRGVGEVHLPSALERQYAKAPKEWAWQWVSPRGRLRTGYRCRCRSCRTGALPATDSWE
jgi:hypothetical protein